jgi:hypothetical protein
VASATLLSLHSTNPSQVVQWICMLRPSFRDGISRILNIITAMGVGIQDRNGGGVSG